jgi:anti-sigma regulatory factor (Ser/Thr protein kinase)
MRGLLGDGNGRGSASGLPVLVDLRLPPDRASAGAARHALEGLSPRLPTDLVESLRLLVSELVTNSFRHAALQPTQWIGLTVRLSRRIVRVEVSDAGPGFEPTIDSPSIYQESGWGLFLLDRISDRWGVDRAGRSTVWFEIDLAA